MQRCQNASAFCRGWVLFLAPRKISEFCALRILPQSELNGHLTKCATSRLSHSGRHFACRQNVSVNQACCPPFICLLSMICNATQALPEWSQSTLEAHRSDPRPHLKSDEQLDKAETGDPIWDAAQYQLALTGVHCCSSFMLAKGTRMSNKASCSTAVSSACVELHACPA